jgi:hypothetical protein
MNREELNWLLQTIQDANTAQGFVLAQYERGRISFQMMADITRGRGSVNRNVHQFGSWRLAAHPNTRRRITNCDRPIGATA